MAEQTKRPYDATSRRARAEQERRATRLRVFAAARDLFVERGYSATTVNDIAKAAGVALQTVYTAGESKSDLMRRVVELAVAGDDEEILVQDRAAFSEIGTEHDPARQVTLIAALAVSITSRVGPVWAAFREAAASDPKAAADLAELLQHRRQTTEVAVRLLPEDRLRASYEETADAVWAISSLDVYLLLTEHRGWDLDHYARWLEQAMTAQVLRPAE